MASTTNGTITSVQAVYVPADDLTDPGAAAVMDHLDGRVILSRPMAAAGLYPAVDPLASQSRLLDPAAIGENHYRVAEHVRSALARYRELEDVIVMLGVDELSVQDRTLVRRAPEAPALPHPALHRVRGVHGRKGARVPLEETLLVCERILDGAADAVEEQRLYMRGGLESFEEALQ